MASKGVSGWTQEEIDERREEWNENKGSRHRLDPDADFDEAYCLAPIPHQPDDYDGPPRYCMSPRVMEMNGGADYRCKHHGGTLKTHPENLHHLAAMKHGMNAAREHLVEDFDEKDQALYDFIVGSYAEQYDIDPETDPSGAYDLHRLAAEIVRAERGRGFLIEEGEIVENPVRNEEGRVVVDEEGDVVTEKSEHYLAKMMHRQDKKITQLEKELGVSRKERLKHDQTDSAVEAFKNFAEVGKTILGREDRDFDGDAEPWKEEDGAE